MRLVGTVPISSTRAKDAIRAVAAALKEGEVVCLFPEGQITRHGMLNELRKGFELMARQGDAQVVPVCLYGLYGSLFSFQGGKFFAKRPKYLRYPVEVHFGDALASREATALAVRHAMHALNSEAFLQSKIWTQASDDVAAYANALRLAAVEWYRAGDVFLSLEPAGSVIHRTVKALTQFIPGSKSIKHADEAHASHIIAFGTRASLAKLTGHERLAFCLDSDLTPLPSTTALRGYIDAETGILLSAEVPDPEMPEGEAGGQLGKKASSIGRLLPGLKIETSNEGVRISGLMPGDERSIIIPGLNLDEQGFLTAAPSQIAS